MKEKERRRTREHAPQTRGHTLHHAMHYDTITALLTLGKEQAVREMTVELAQVEPGEWVLDVGCGTGTLALAAKRQAGPSGKVFGVDIINPSVLKPLSCTSTILPFTGCSLRIPSYPSCR